MTNATDAASLDALRAELAIANRILVSQGVLDAFGHVSVRHPARADRFLLARNMAPASVTAADVLEFELDGLDDQRLAGTMGYGGTDLHGESPGIIGACAAACAQEPSV